MSDTWVNFTKWAASPFTADMSALHWFFFIGLLAIASIGWRVILGNLTRS